MAPTVLIADDEPSILRSTALLLEDMGFKVSTCDAAAGILEMLRIHRPDLLLQDVRMPGLDLERLIVQIRADDTLVPVPRIVLFTASMNTDEVRERVGLRWVLEKPFKPHEMVDMLNRALEDAGPSVA